MALTDLLKGAGRVVQAAALGLAVYGCGGESNESSRLVGTWKTEEIEALMFTSAGRFYGLRHAYECGEVEGCGTYTISDNTLTISHYLPEKSEYSGTFQISTDGDTLTIESTVLKRIRSCSEEELFFESGEDELVCRNL